MDSQLTDVEVEGEGSGDESDFEEYNDSDYDQTSDEETDKNDDNVYAENINSMVEWMGIKEGEHQNIDKGVGDHSGDSDLEHNSGQSHLVDDHILQQSFGQESGLSHEQSFGLHQHTGSEVRKKTKSSATQAFRIPRSSATSQPTNPTLCPPRPPVPATTGVYTRAGARLQHQVPPAPQPLPTKRPSLPRKKTTNTTSPSPPNLHPGPGRVNIRHPVPFAQDHPPITIEERAKLAAEHGFPVLKKDGRKFATLSNLSAAVKATSLKDKGKKKA
ncbi:hypothetical protein Salat_1671200 [Sesamum alatum]|uniref:Uncharacterized protein n=1 Tax=Sesamum alatum TaxID=300844 RepID=A0AAE2CJT0_9LAMI|nr:hypothetical protein Salat_1671200 [Sesamum alatum]